MSRVKQLGLLAACGCCLLSTDPALGLACTLVGHNTAVVHDAKGTAVPLPAASYAICEGLRVVQGPVTACTMAARGRKVCHDYPTGHRLSQADLQRQGGGQGPWKTLLDLLRGSPETVTALSRGRDDALLPTGRVLLLQDVALAPDFVSWPALRGSTGIDVFVGRPDGPKLLTLQPGGPRTLLTKDLKPGHTYYWRIQPPAGSLPVSGQFTLLGNAQRQQARAELQRLQTQAGGDVGAVTIQWAAWLAEKGYHHEARQALQAQGLSWQ